MIAVKLKMVAIALVFCVVPLIAAFVDSGLKKPKNVRKSVTNEHFTIEYPRYVFWVGAVGCFTALGVFAVFIVNGETPVRGFHEYILGGYVAYFWFTTYVLTEAKTSKTVIYYGIITVYRPFRRTFSFSFSDIISVKRKVTKLYYVTDEKIIVSTKSGKKMSVGSLEMQYDRLCRLIKTNVPNELLIGFD